MLRDFPSGIFCNEAKQQPYRTGISGREKTTRTETLVSVMDNTLLWKQLINPLRKHYPKASDDRWLPVDENGTPAHSMRRRWTLKQKQVDDWMEADAEPDSSYVFCSFRGYKQEILDDGKIKTAQP